MTTQIAVRLPAEMVRFLDDAVAAGHATSRTAIVTSAIEREIRAMMARQDVRMLEHYGAESELDALVAWQAGRIELD